MGREVLAAAPQGEPPTFDDVLNQQTEDVIKAKGRGKLDDLFAADDVWEVK